MVVLPYRSNSIVNITVNNFDFPPIYLYRNFCMHSSEIVSFVIYISATSCVLSVKSSAKTCISLGVSPSHGSLRQGLCSFPFHYRRHLVGSFRVAREYSVFHYGWLGRGFLGCVFLSESAIAHFKKSDKAYNK